MPVSKVIIYFLDNKVNKCKTMRYQYKDDIISRLHRWGAANLHHHLPHSRNMKELVTTIRSYTIIRCHRMIFTHDKFCLQLLRKSKAGHKDVNSLTVTVDS